MTLEWSVSMSYWSKNMVRNVTHLIKIIQILCLFNFDHLWYVDHTTALSSPLYFCQLAFDTNSCQIKLVLAHQTGSIVYMFVWNFFFSFPELLFSRLVLGNWKQNGETPLTRMNPSLTNLRLTLWCEGESVAFSDGQCGREFPETFSWCDVCQQNWPYTDWRMYVNTETILRWDFSNVKQQLLL